MSDISQLLIEQVKSARADKSPLNIVGGGSKQFMGRAATGTDICIAGHSGIVSYQPEELVITARAGTTVSEVQAVLAEHDQTLSFDPPTFGGLATIGGTLACHLSGPGRPWLGSVRDMVLGTRLINGKAEYLRFGGQVIKNVAGYDVARLQAGAMGTLGIISEISFKVMPKSAASVSLVQELEVTEAIRVMNELSAQAKPLTAACWLNNKLYVRLAGAKSAVDGTVSQWSGDVLDNADQFWQDLREQDLPFFSNAKELWRFSIKSSSEHFMPEENCLIDWGGAQRWLSMGNADNHLSKTQLEIIAEKSGGQVGLFRGGDRSGDVLHTQPEAMKRMYQNLKDSFDPDGLFNPGRLYSWM